MRLQTESNLSSILQSYEIPFFSLSLFFFSQSDDEDCQYPQWYHQSCFFKTRLPSTEAALDGFALLRYSDQLTIRDELG